MSTLRERFLAVMNFEPVECTLRWESGYWAGAMQRWYAEGLPSKRGIPLGMQRGQMIVAEFAPRYGQSEGVDSDVHELLQMDGPMYSVPLALWFVPAFEEEVLEDHGLWAVVRNRNGVIERNWKDRSGFPGWLRGPVGDRDDWERIKAERLRPTLEGRLPENWTTLSQELRERDFPLCLGDCPAGFYGGARQLLGESRVLTAFYDEPDLVRDIMGYLADFYVALYDRVLQQVQVDAAFIWEDMCYKNGPLISPAMFREFMLPNYKKLTACLRDHGINVIMVDTDGDARRIIPLLIEGGVSVLMPCEVNAGMDVVALREAFPRLGLIGGIDKTRLAAGRELIDEELERKIPFMLERGGYIPMVDHEVPPDVSWQNFRYYRSKLNTMIAGQTRSTD